MLEANYAVGQQIARSATVREKHFSGFRNHDAAGVTIQQS
jgi:hypothetical protein